MPTIWVWGWTDMSSGPGTVVDPIPQGRTAESPRVHHPEWERGFSRGGGKGASNREEGRQLFGMVWGWIRPSRGSVHPHLPLSQGLPCEGKIWGIMAKTGTTRGTHISTTGTLLRRSSSRISFSTSERERHARRSWAQGSTIWFQLHPVQKQGKLISAGRQNSGYPCRGSSD